MSGPCEIKGVAFHTFFEALSELRGEVAAELTRAELTTELRERLRLGAISRVGYYPMSVYSEVHAAAQRALRGGEIFARDLGRKATEIDTRGILRFVLGVASPGLLMRYADKVWSSYARGAEILIEKRDSTHYAIDFRNLGGASDLVFAEMEGSIETLLRRTGAHDTAIRRQNGKDGTSARYWVTWRE